MSSPYSAAFDGSDYLSATNYTGNPAAFSVSCWVYLNASQTSRVFFSNYQATGDAGWAPGISDSDANRLKFYLGGNTVASPTTLVSQFWHHAVFVYDGTVGRIYLNGDTTPNASLTSSVVYGAVPASNFIGSLNTASQRVNGRLAAVGYWSKALTTTEVTSLFNGGAGLAFADLSGSLLTSLGSYHDFADSGDLGLDSTASARHYTNTGAVARADGPSSVASTLRTAIVAGNWSAAATWGGRTPPADGDTADIPTDVVLDIDATVGLSGASGTAAVTVASTGSLTWATDATLTCRGDLIVSGAGGSPLSNVRLSMVGGSALVFDATAASAGVQYGLQLGTGHFQTPMLLVRASALNPASIRSNTTGGALPGYFIDGSFIGQGSIDAEYLNLTDFGDATLPAWKPWAGTNGDNYVRFDHGTFTRCGETSCATTLHADATFVIAHRTWVDTVAAKCLALSASTAMGTGTRSITYSSFDKILDLFAYDFTIAYCVFSDSWVTSNYPWASFSHCFVRDTQGSALSMAGDASDCYYIEDNPGEANPHGFGCVNNLDQDAAFERIVVESVDGGAGDFIFPHSPASPRTTTIRNCILLPAVGLGGAYGISPGKLVAMLGGANTTAVVEHCTMPAGDDDEHGVWAGETYGGHAGMISSLKSNLVWRPTAGTKGYKFTRWSTTVQDILSAASGDYNWGWHLAAGSDGNGYHASNTATPIVSTGTLGAHDGSGDPQFLNSSRNLASWATTQGSVSTTAAGKRADAIDYLRADPAKVDALLAWVRAGFAPANAAMEHAAHDDAAPATVALGTPGAVAYAAAPGRRLVRAISSPAGGVLVLDLPAAG